MNTTVALRHRTEYHYPSPAVLSPQLARLRPTPGTRTPISRYSLSVEPAGARIRWQQDPFGNQLANILVGQPTDHFSIEVDLEAELVPVNPFDFLLDPAAETMPVAYDAAELLGLSPYMGLRGPSTQATSADLDHWFGQVLDEAQPQGATSPSTVSFLIEVAARVSAMIAYEVRYEEGTQTSEATFARRAGSCRDSAWLLVETYRRLGLAARFVSGYLVELGPEDSTDLHAWAEVYLPGAGWIGVDPTSGLAVGEGHIPLAAAPSPQLAAAITGTSSVAADRFGYVNTVIRINAAP